MVDAYKCPKRVSVLYRRAEGTPSRSTDLSSRAHLYHNSIKPMRLAERTFTNSKLLICIVASWPISTFGLSAQVNPSRFDRPEKILKEKEACLNQNKDQKNKALWNSKREKIIADLTKDFCLNPSQFCQAIRKLNSQVDALSFVNSKCESGAIPADIANWITVQFEKNHQIEFTQFGADFIRSAWRCNRPTASGTDELTSDCLDNAIPFNCDDLKEEKVGIASKLELQKIGAKFSKKGTDICQIKFRRQESIKPADFMRSSEMAFNLGFHDLIRTYISKKELEKKGKKQKEVQETKQKITNWEIASISLLMRGAYSPERLKKASLYFEVARDAVIQFLRDMAAPADIINLAARTELVDLSTFFTKFDKITPAQKEKIELLGYACHPYAPNRPLLGEFNAFNMGVLGNNRVALCPAYLLHAEFANPLELLLVFAHEVAHSIDPCSLGLLDLHFNPKFSQGKCSEANLRSSMLDMSLADQPSSSGQQSYLDFIRQVRGGGGVAECLTKKFIKGTSSQKFKIINELLENHEGCLSPSYQCWLEQSNPGGALNHCEFPLPKLLSELDQWIEKLSPGHCSGLKSAIDHGNTVAFAAEATDSNAINQKSQVQEMFSDLVAAGALPHAMESAKLFPVKLQNSLDKRAEILTSLGYFCAFEAVSIDSHPQVDIRFNSISDPPGIRKFLGCEQFEPKRQSGEDVGRQGPYSCLKAIDYGYHSKRP